MALTNFKLENLPRRIQIAIIAVVAIGLIAIAYMYLLKDMVEARSALLTEIAKLEKSVSEAAAIEKQLSEFKRELAELDARLVELRLILPDQKETPEVLRNVQLMAAESNLKIVRFVPQPVSPKEFYSDWPISMEVQGSYNALGRFFEKIGQFARIVNVDNISIKGIEGSTDPSKTLNSNCTATTFVYREDQGTAPGK